MPFDQSVRRSFWLVPLAAVAVIAFLNAQAITQLVGVGVAVDGELLARPPVRSPLSPPPPSDSARDVSAEPILERNPFDHETGSLLPQASSETEDAPTVAVGNPWTAPACDGFDVGVIVASDDLDWSLVAVTAAADKKTRLLRRGNEISGKQVHFIGWDRVWFSSEGELCQAKLFDQKEAPATPPPAASSAAPIARSKAEPLSADMRKGIRALSATEFDIDRGVVDKVLENQAALMRQARITPVQENGRVIGVRLTGIRPDTLLGVLGMQNGDRLQTINGFEIANPEKALEAYARLRTADKLAIRLDRNGKNVELNYNIK